VFPYVFQHSNYVYHNKNNILQEIDALIQAKTKELNKKAKEKSVKWDMHVQCMCNTPFMRLGAVAVTRI